MTEIQIVPVAPNALISRWAEVSPMIESAMAELGNRYEAIDILLECLNNRGQAWFGMAADDDKTIRSVVVTQAAQYARRRGLSFICIAGEPIDPEAFMGYAQQLECDHIQTNYKVELKEVPPKE